MEQFIDFDFINREMQKQPLDDYEKRMIRNGKRRKVPISREETLEFVEEQREIYADHILEIRLLLLSEGISKNQILLWENDPEGRCPWDIYAESAVGKAELSLRRRMEEEQYRRWRKQNPDTDDIPF